jgi:hypothetical protein
MFGGKAVEGLDANEILESLGLMRKSQQSSWLWPALGGLGFGLICGAALGLAFAPDKGSQLRKDIAGKLKDKDFAGLGETARNAVRGAQGSETTGGRGHKGV